MTSIIGGIELAKHHVRIEAYGTVDELNSNIGWLRDQDIKEDYKNELIKIQEVLFTIGSHLATDRSATSIHLPSIEEKHIEMLEKSIDKMDDQLPAMTNFILPGGHPAVSAAHVTRSVCRRAERWVTAFNEREKVDGIILKYLNRLSDYFFVLSRQIAADHKVPDLPWKP